MECIIETSAPRNSQQVTCIFFNAKKKRMPSELGKGKRVSKLWFDSKIMDRQIDRQIDLFGYIYRLQWCHVIKKLQLTILYIIGS